MIVDLGAGSKSFQKPEREGVLGELGHFVFRIIQITEGDRLGRTCFGACGNVVSLFQLFSIFRVRLILCPHQTVMAESAFFNHPPHAYRHLGRKGSIHAFILRKPIPPAEVSSGVRAGCLTVSATDAPGVNLADNPRVKIKFGGSGNAYGNAGRMMIAVHAWSWKITDFRMWKFFAIAYFIKTHPCSGTLFV